jgi:hypothetical protein
MDISELVGKTIEDVIGLEKDSDCIKFIMKNKEEDDVEYYQKHYKLVHFQNCCERLL